MTAVSNLYLSAELTITPTRKRKRQFERQEQQQLEHELALKTTAAPPTSGFTNAAFSSTPKKILAKRRLNAVINKENSQTFAATIGLEVKSIADIAKDNGDGAEVPLNPYEVIRKPPKKKKKQTEEAACFENPALNLDLPEKQFNPYEIVREKTPAANTNCFVNSALNLKTKDVPASRNPFEIRREIPSNNSPSIPCSLKIGLPFVPTVGCRIDFKDMTMSHLTPSKLLAEKLVFSPVVKGKASLGSIGEETTMDIGKELDRYQLELENSINEAKLRKNCICDTTTDSPVVSSLQIYVEQDVKVTQKLKEIKESEETEQITEETIKPTQQHTVTVVNEEKTECGTNPFENKNIVAQSVEATEKVSGQTNPFACDEHEYLAVEEDLDELYGYGENGDDNDLVANESFDFKTPAPFVRAYTKPATPILRVSKESLNSVDNMDKPFDPEEHSKKSLNVKSIIRKSIRKLMHPHHNKREEVIDNAEKLDNDKHSVGLMGAIRLSLRRKQARTLLRNETIESKDCELSIIDGSERTMKFKSDQPQTDYVKIEDLANEKKNNIRNSIRRSTREMGHQFMKTVFHKKHEEYDFGK